MTGTAELVAEEVRDTLAAAGIAVELLVMDRLDARVFARGGVFLVCTSTYGQGDIPDNGQALFGSLEQSRPELGPVEYGGIAPGDRTYAATFCFGGKRF